MMIVFCDAYTCKHNDGNACLLSAITLEDTPIKLEQGKWECGVICQSYKGVDDDTGD